MNNRIIYQLGHLNLNDLGVVVKSADGLFDLPAPRTRTEEQWADISGKMVDVKNAPTFESREIDLDCSMVCLSISDFVTKTQALRDLFLEPDLLRLTVTIGDTSLYYLVYIRDSIEFDRKWGEGVILASFTLSLVEPEPFKRVYKATVAKNATVTAELTAVHPVNIEWGDGKVTYDATTGKVSHVYAAAGDAVIIITGDIKQLESTITNATLIWTLF